METTKKKVITMEVNGMLVCIAEENFSKFYQMVKGHKIKMDPEQLDELLHGKGFQKINNN